MADKWQLIYPNHINAIVDGYEATIEHFRKSSETGNLAHGNFFLAQQFRGAAGGNDIDALSLKRAGERRDAGLVGNGDERAGDFHQDRKEFNRGLHG